MMVRISKEERYARNNAHQKERYANDFTHREAKKARSRLRYQNDPAVRARQLEIEHINRRKKALLKKEEKKPTTTTERYHADPKFRRAKKTANKKYLNNHPEKQAEIREKDRIRLRKYQQRRRRIERQNQYIPAIIKSIWVI